MARTERVTVRLPEQDVQTLDALVQLGEFGNRSEAVRQAVRDLILERAERLDDLQEKLEKLQKLQNMAETAEQVDEEYLQQ